MNDLILLKRALQVEMDKRSAILAADGRELQRKTRESEEVVRQMRLLADGRRDRPELSPEARKLAEKLRDEANENQRLLENASSTIHRLLTDMGEKETTYAPGRKGATGGGGILLDASV